MRPADAHARDVVERQLAEWLGSAKQVAAPYDADFAIETKRHRFIVEYKVSSQAASVASAIARMRNWKKARSHDLPLLVVPFMGEVGRTMSAEAGIAWLDLSGNANIRTADLVIQVDGRPNAFKPVGRPRSVFTPTASRVTRWLLAHPTQEFSQREIATETELDEGFVSRIVRQLVDQNLVVRRGRRVAVRDPSLLLTAWAETYDFSNHVVVRAHGAARSSEALCARISASLTDSGFEHAATGLTAAWLMTHFAGFRLVTLFVQLLPDAAFLDQLGVRSVERGENVWLVVPNDAGVFQAKASHDGIPCVHPAQVYVDLKAQPERAAEAAESVRAFYLRGARDGKA